MLPVFLGIILSIAVLPLFRPPPSSFSSPRTEPRLGAGKGGGYRWDGTRRREIHDKALKIYFDSGQH